MTGLMRASEQLYRRGLRVMPAGVSRNTLLRHPHPLYAAYGSGCRVTDVDGVSRIDFANNMASLIHGHAHPAIVAAASERLRRGSAFTLATEAEVAFAEHLCARSDSFEQIRFMNSGTEAVMTAIRAARAATGRTKIAKVEGSYHGSYDFAEVSQEASQSTWGPLDAPSPVPVAHGTPTGVLDSVVIIPFNDTERAIRILERHQGELACVVVDLMPHRIGLCPADADFVAALWEWTRRDGSLFVVDEVITFRNAYGGAQQLYGITPDLTALGKIIGGGLPVGAVAGSADIMAVMDSRGEGCRLPQSGTFSANPVTMAAGLAAMELFDRDQIARVNRLARLAIKGIRAVIRARGVQASVSGSGSMFRIFMTETAPRTYRESYADPAAKKRLNRLLDDLLDHQILLIYSGAGAISTVMGEEEIDHLVSALDRVWAKWP